MTTAEATPQTVPAPAPPVEKTKGQVYEGIAFTFCKAATIILITQKLALPVAAGAAAIFYVLAIIHGQKTTRCMLRLPVVSATFWGVICLVSLYLTIPPLVAQIAHVLAHPAAALLPHP